jgi:hypothetical protein
MASTHLLEAGKYLSNIESFKEESQNILQLSYMFASVIKPEIPKVSEEKMQSILDEILGNDLEVE